MPPADSEIKDLRLMSFNKETNAEISTESCSKGSRYQRICLGFDEGKQKTLTGTIKKNADG
jgi:hypothetical protein